MNPDDGLVWMFPLAARHGITVRAHVPGCKMLLRAGTSWVIVPADDVEEKRSILEREFPVTVCRCAKQG
jgi:hypothetical protein